MTDEIKSNHWREESSKIMAFEVAHAIHRWANIANGLPPTSRPSHAPLSWIQLSLARCNHKQQQQNDVLIQTGMHVDVVAKCTTRPLWTFKHSTSWLCPHIVRRSVATRKSSWASIRNADWPRWTMKMDKNFCSYVKKRNIIANSEHNNNNNNDSQSRPRLVTTIAWLGFDLNVFRFLVIDVVAEMGLADMRTSSGCEQEEDGGRNRRRLL